MCRLSKDTILKRQMQFQDREDQLIELAKNMIETEGFSAFSMERLVRECSYSKGTVYKHFSSKEDCVAEIAIRGQKQMISLFQSAVNFDGLMRERFLAIHFAFHLYHQMYPSICHSINTIRTPAFAEKVSPERAELIKTIDSNLFDIVYQMIEQAESDGSVIPDARYNRQVLVHLNWAMIYGVNSIVQTGFDIEVVNQLQQANMFLKGANVLLDGAGVQPLSNEYDFEKTWKFFETDLFSEELKQLQIMKKNRVSQAISL